MRQASTLTLRKDGAVGLSDRDYMKRTPEELRRDYDASVPSRVRLSGEALAWVVGVAIALYVLGQLGLAARLGIPLP
jgi:hypothetical protein